MALRQALPNINPALVAGVRVLPRTPVIEPGARGGEALKALAQDPNTNVAVNGAGSTVKTLEPDVALPRPVPDGLQWLELLVDLSGRARLRADPVRHGPARAAQLRRRSSRTTSARSAGDPAGAPARAAATEYLHSQSYGAAIDNYGNADCENGQRGYSKQLNLSDPQHRNLVSDPHVPGNQGTLYTGLSRVPPGETFTRNPSTGPALAFNPANP